jgi:NAD(P)-dependent dehydrogenase (short-subunit alcohol dehydrogenase family)
MPDSQPSTLIALVSGANRGLGLETCRQLAERGYRVILTSRNQADGKAAVGRLVAQGLDVYFHPLDVTSDSSVADLRDWVGSQFGRLHVLVNNAGIFIDRSSNILDIPIETFQQTLDTNLTGALRLSQAFIPGMVRQNYGRVVNVSSGMGELASIHSSSPAYRMSKLALNVLTRMLADAVRGKNVLVNAINPGWVRTDMGGSGASRSLEQGASGIVWAATLPDGGPNGGFFLDGKRIEF